MAARYSHNAIYYRCLFWWQSSSRHSMTALRARLMCLFWWLSLSRHGMTALQWGGGNTVLSFLMVDVELPQRGKTMLNRLVK